MPFLSDYACKVCLQRLSKISLREACFLLPTSSRHLGILRKQVLTLSQEVRMEQILGLPPKLPRGLGMLGTVEWRW
jgi:hypothetical protein